MRAVTLSAAPPELTIVEIADPSPAADEVLLSVTACGICGSDLHVAAVIGEPGTILGHEIAGVVAALGTDVDPTQWRIGQPVAARPMGGCGVCAWCSGGRPDHCATFQLAGLNRPGGFAELVSLPARELWALPASLTGPDQALVEPLAVARRGLRRAGLQAGETIAVIGAGPVGLAVVAWARALGAGAIVVSDPSPSRRELALLLGADTVIDPTAADLAAATLETTGVLPSVVFECSGRPEQIGKAMDQVGVDGRVTVLGLCISDVSIFPFTGLSKELDLRFSLYYGREDFTDTITAIDAGTLDPRAMITETVDLPGLPARFAELSHNPDGGKVIVLP